MISSFILANADQNKPVSFHFPYEAFPGFPTIPVCSSIKRMHNLTELRVLNRLWLQHIRWSGYLCELFIWIFMDIYLYGTIVPLLEIPFVW